VVGVTRVAVVGTGAIAETHLACLGSLPGVEVVGVVDLSPARAEATAERFGVHRWYADTAEMLADARPDAVHVTTPPNAHVDIALAALRAGAHVVVEKPVAPTYEGWTRLRDEARARGLQLIENQNYRFAREVRQVQGLIAAGTFGRVHQIDVRFFQSITGEGHAFADPFVPHPTLRLRGGPITDFLPHMASLVHAFLGEPTDVHATWLPGEAGLTPVPYVDMVGTVRTDAGLATLSFGGRSGPDGFWISVFGEHAQARINLYEGRLTIDSIRGGPPPLRPVVNAVAEARGTVFSATRSLWGKLTSGPGSYEGLWFLLDAFYASLEEGTEPPLSLDDVDATARLVAGLTSYAEELQ
jgi:predicted dehydrogenase